MKAIDCTGKPEMIYERLPLSRVEELCNETFIYALDNPWIIIVSGGGAYKFTESGLSSVNITSSIENLMKRASKIIPVNNNTVDKIVGVYNRKYRIYAVRGIIEDFWIPIQYAIDMSSKNNIVFPYEYCDTRKKYPYAFYLKDCVAHLVEVDRTDNGKNLNSDV